MECVPQTLLGSESKSYVDKFKTQEILKASMVFKVITRYIQIKF